MNDERWLSLEEIAQHLGVSNDSVYRWIKTGMPAHKLGRMWRFKISEVDDWVKNGPDEISEDDDKQD